MEVKIPNSVVVIELDNAPFRNAHEAKLWACLHGIPGKMSDEDTRGKGEISISLSSLEKMLSGQALRKSVTPAIHYAALVRLRDIIRESFVAEIHPDFRKVDGKRSPFNGINPMVQIAVLYGCVALGGIAYRAKTTLKLHRDPSQPTKAYSYEISNIEVLTGTARIVILPNVKTSTAPRVLRGTAESLTQPSCKISMDASILLNGVCDVNGAPLLPGVVQK